MIYLLSDTGRKNQLLYAFDTKKSFESIEYKLVRLEHVQYDFDGFTAQRETRRRLL